MKDPVTDNYLLFKETNMRDLNMQDAWTQDYNISFSGGNEKEESTIQVLDIMMKQAFHWNLVMSVYLLI